MNASTLSTFIDAHRRIHGHLPKLRELVEQADGKLLNVLMCLMELDDARKDELRQMARADRAEQKRRQGGRT
jgi:hypothetical protein